MQYVNYEPSRLAIVCPTHQTRIVAPIMIQLSQATTHPLAPPLPCAADAEIIMTLQCTLTRQARESVRLRALFCLYASFDSFKRAHYATYESMSDL